MSTIARIFLSGVVLESEMLQSGKLYGTYQYKLLRIDSAGPGGGINFDGIEILQHLMPPEQDLKNGDELVFVVRRILWHYCFLLPFCCCLRTIEVRT